MLDTLMSWLAPHRCCGCGKMGRLLCDSCKNNIVEAGQTACLACGCQTVSSGLCKQCKTSYQRAWVVGRHSGTLRRLINDYKLQGKQEACRHLGDLLLQILPDLPSSTVVVSVPTIARHVRQRGLDHTRLLAKYIARHLGLSYQPLISRLNSEVQLGASASKRRVQARRAFEVFKKLDSKMPYLIIDDVATTGATIEAAALALRQAGAKTVWVAVVARR